MSLFTENGSFFDLPTENIEPQLTLEQQSAREFKAAVDLIKHEGLNADELAEYSHKKTVKADLGSKPGFFRRIEAAGLGMEMFGMRRPSWVLRHFTRLTGTALLIGTLGLGVDKGIEGVEYGMQIPGRSAQLAGATVDITKIKPLSLDIRSLATGKFDEALKPVLQDYQGNVIQKRVELDKYIFDTASNLAQSLALLGTALLYGWTRPWGVASRNSTLVFPFIAKPARLMGFLGRNLG